MSTECLSTLPVEILYRIFDNLDIQTIFLSLRYVCKQLYLTTNSFYRYNFNFKSIAKPYFYSICQRIPFENVVSLTLSDQDATKGQIQLFLSLFRIEQFIRLQSLTLREIEEVHLNKFLNYVITSSLKSFSLTTRIVHDVRQDTTFSLLGLAISHPTLQNLHLNLCYTDWNGLQWPTNNSLHYIRIVSSITLKQFCVILQHSPKLRTLILKEVDIDNSEAISTTESFQQLTSLTFEDGRVDIRKLEACLSLTPALTHLKLIGNGSLFSASFDGSLWANIIQTKLRLLKKFEFFILVLTYHNFRSSNIERLMSSFESPFWTEELKCRITCDHIKNSNKIVLYTLPICTTRLEYHIDYKNTTASNFKGSISRADMNYVRKLELVLTNDANSTIRGKNKPLNNVLFPNVTNLTIGNSGEWTINSIEFLSTLVDLSHITKMSLSVNFCPEQMLNTVTNISKLLNETSNLRSLSLNDFWAPGNCMSRIKTIFSMIPRNIKYLKIRVKNIDDIKYILEKLENLTSVTFDYAQILTINRQDFIQSLSYLKRYTSLWDSQCALHVWLGDKKPI